MPATTHPVTQGEQAVKDVKAKAAGTDGRPVPTVKHKSENGLGVNADQEAHAAAKQDVKAKRKASKPKPAAAKSV